MKIFVSGIAGFLGSHVADRMLSLGHEVVGADTLIGGYLDNVPRGAEFHQRDVGDFDAMVRILNRCEVVFHAACTPYEGLSAFSPSLISYNTFQITASLLSAAIQNRARRFVFCSSMARYGTQEVLPFTEDMVCRPQDPYGISKYAAELLIKNLCDLHGMEYCVCVPHNIIGPRQKYDDPYRNVAAIMINRMLQGQQPVIYGDGNQRRCFSFIADDIACIERMILDTGLHGETINIGPDDEFVTINELARTLADLLDFDLHPIYFADRPGEVRLANCSASKARRLLGYRTQTGLREGLREMIAYIRERGPKPFHYHLDLEIVSDLCPRTWRERLF
jgi:UDP-glucose 4-epimerase